MMTLSHYLAEAFKDLGKLTSDQLKKGQKIAPGAADNFQQVTGRVFYTVLTEMIKRDVLRGKLAKGLKDLSTYKIAEYDKMKCFIGINNSSGFALKKGDLVSVFSTQGSSGNAIVAEAVKQGAKTLDCFATISTDGTMTGALYSLYTKHGFKIDTSLTTGDGSKPYDIVKGVSYYTDGVTDDKENPNVVIFMKR